MFLGALRRESEGGVRERVCGCDFHREKVLSENVTDQ